MPSFPTTTSYAVLGLLSVRSWTTYELAKQVQRSLNWFWPRAERKLYDEPKQLAEHGYAVATERFTGKRRSREYAITDEGRAALAELAGAAGRAPDRRVRGHGEGVLRRRRRPASPCAARWPRSSPRPRSERAPWAPLPQRRSRSRSGRTSAPSR